MGLVDGRESEGEGEGEGLWYIFYLKVWMAARSSREGHAIGFASGAGLLKQ
jgi:hypothetical protein